MYAVAALGGLLTPYLTLAVCVVMGLYYLLPARRTDAESAHDGTHAIAP